MNERGRRRTAMGLSGVVHLAPVVWILATGLFPRFEMPEIEFELTEVELIDPDQIQGDDGPGIDEPPPLLEPPPPEEIEEPQPEEPDPPESIEPKPEPEKKKPKKKREPPPPELTHPKALETDSDLRRTMGSKHSNVDNLGPTNSTFYFFLVPKRVRDMKHAQAAMDVMASFPDFEYLVDGGGFDPLHDFDHLVISTPNITDPRQTFLVVDYTMDREDVRRTIDRAAANRGERIEWVEEAGVLRGNPVPTNPGLEDWDPRWFVLPEEPKIAAYIREEFVPALLREEVGEEKTAANYVANLAKLSSFAEQIPNAGFQFVQKDLHAALKRVRGLPFPVPDGLEVTVEAAADPEAFIRATFLTPEDAAQTRRWFEEDLKQIIAGSLTLRFGVQWLYDLVQVEQQEQELRLWVRLTSAQTARMLGMARDQVAKVQRKDPDEIERSRRRRLDNWEMRKSGEYSPAELDRLERERAEREARAAAAAKPPPVEASPPPEAADPVQIEPSSEPPAGPATSP